MDFNRSKLGLGLKIEATQIDLAAEVESEVAQLRVGHADSVIEFEAGPGICGCWDAERMKQVTRNLVSNAINYGDANSPIEVFVYGTSAEARLEVTNRGPEIPTDELDRIFDPLRRASEDGGRGLGLGLFIVREVVEGHGGDIEVTSRGGKTTFTVRLPRRGGTESEVGSD